MEENKIKMTIVNTIPQFKLLCQGFMIGNEDEPMKRYMDFKMWCNKHVDIDGLNNETIETILWDEVYAPQFKYGDIESVERYKIPEFKAKLTEYDEKGDYPF